MSKEIFALDLGNLQTKLKSRKAESVLLSSFVDTDEIGMSLGLIDSSKDLHKFVSDVDPDFEYTWGKDLVKNRSIKDSIIQTISFEQRYQSTDFLLLTDFSLAYLAKDFVKEYPIAESNPLDVVLILGLPTSDFKQDDYKNTLPTSLKGVHHIKMDGKDFYINVSNVIIVNQSVGTLYDLTFNDDGSVKTKAFTDSNGIIVDYGGGTILLDGYENAVLTKNQKQLEIGAYKFYTDVIDKYLENNVSHITMKEIDVQQAVKDGNDDDGYYYKPNNNQSIDITAEVLRQKKVTTKQVLRNINSTFKNLSLFDYIIFTGGGANLLDHNLIERELERFSIKLHFMSESEFANVRGYYKFGLAYANQYNRR